jgi:hypothetical protein
VAVDPIEFLIAMGSTYLWALMYRKNKNLFLNGNR